MLPVQRVNYGLRPTKEPVNVVLHGPRTLRKPSPQVKALPDFQSFIHLSSFDTSSLGQEVKSTFEAWPGLDTVSAASFQKLQPFLDALQAAGSGISLDAMTLADMNNALAGASPHMGSTAALAALDALSSWATAALGSAQEAAASLTGTAQQLQASGSGAATASLPGSPPSATLLPAGLAEDVGAALAGLRSVVEALGAPGSDAAAGAGATLRALATTLAAVTSSLGSFLDGSAPPVDMGKLLAGLAAAMGPGASGAEHAALVHNPVVAVVSAAALLVVVAVAESVEAQRGLWEADEGSREATLALMQAERAAQARSILLKDGCYCPERLADYFADRPVLVAKRAAQVAVEAARFGAALALDFATGAVEQNEKQRAAQMRGVIERLGPAYVKVAQALSTRVDLLSPAYFEQIQLLQDRVPPFPTTISRTVLETSLGKPVDAMFETLSERPVAAASLGQVYYGVLRKEYGGKEVAVKVQRPGVLEAVALDLMLIRSIAVAIQAQSRVDWAGIIDAWALRFFHEMDYGWEARAMNTFAKQMAPLKGIKVTEAVEELCSDEVLTTGWIRGEKLSESNAPDVRELCNSLLNAYLVQLLETGFLHADPHPGNLMRSDDGRLVILDFGLMTEVTEEQRGALISYIAHLCTEDWAALAYDLQALGFIPKNVDPSEAGLVEPLGKIMKQLTGGGGAAKVNIDKVVDELDQLGKYYPIEIPPFFALILRAFSVIEGIALGVDPDYAIVQECFPYLSRRLLNDDSPRTRQLLREVLYGRQGRKRLDIERLMRFAEGLSAYTTDALTMKQLPSSAGAQGATRAAGSSPPAAAMPGMRPSSASSAFLAPDAVRTPVTALATSSSSSSSNSAPAASRPATQAPPVPTLDPALREALLVVFSRKGSYIQELLIDELVAAADALSREASSSLLRSLLSSFPLTATQAVLNGLGPMRGVLVPVPTPVDVLKSLAPVVAVTEEDKEALQVVRGILTLAAKAMPSSSTGASLGNRPSSSGGGPSMTNAFVPGGGSSLGAGRSLNSALVANPRSLRRASEEWSPLLAELLPGMAHTGELFVRALLSRVASRLSQSLAAGSNTLQQPAYMASSSGTSSASSSSSDQALATSSSSNGSSRSSGSSSRSSSISSSSGQDIPLRSLSPSSGSSMYGREPLPRGRYAPYSGSEGTRQSTYGDGSQGKGWGAAVLDAAQWMIGGGARISSGVEPEKLKAGGRGKGKGAEQGARGKAK